ncbi:MAG: pilus assembly protein PilP [Pseudomonadota bacterium]
MTTTPTSTQGASTPRRGTHRTWMLLAPFGASLLLGACSNGDLSDLRSYAETVKARPGGRIEPLPEVKSYESFEYSASKLRSPFAPDTELAPRVAAVTEGPRPDPNRRKEYLESFPLDALRMVGTLEIEGRYYGLVRDADGLVHQVLPGQYMGEYDGRVTSVTNAAIEVVELVPNGIDGFTERQAAVAID